MKTSHVLLIIGAIAAAIYLLVYNKPAVTPATRPAYLTPQSSAQSAAAGRNLLLAQQAQNKNPLGNLIGQGVGLLAGLFGKGGGSEGKHGGSGGSGLGSNYKGPGSLSGKTNFGGNEVSKTNVGSALDRLLGNSPEEFNVTEGASSAFNEFGERYVAGDYTGSGQDYGGGYVDTRNNDLSNFDTTPVGGSNVGGYGSGGYGDSGASGSDISGLNLTGDYGGGSNGGNDSYGGSNYGEGGGSDANYESD